MSRARTRQRFAGWIALLAVLLAALMPTVSRALGSVQGSALVVLCSAQGLQALSPDANLPADGAGVVHPLESCLYCSMHGPDPGLPSVAALPQPVLPVRDDLPGNFPAAPRTLDAWSSAQPRAPPSST